MESPAADVDGHAPFDTSLCPKDIINNSLIANAGLRAHIEISE